MSDQEEFLARWMRLKQQGAAARTDAVGARNEETAPSPSEISSSKPAVIDPASLPAIESITSESDIRLFLQSGVPEQLVRAALRTAWVADPAIRDFIGIAESQWDFNDPAAMPGFGPLEAVDSAQSMVSHSVGGLKSAAEPIAAEPIAAIPEVMGPQRDGQVDKVWLSSGMADKNPLNVRIGGPPYSEAAAESRREAHDNADEPGTTRRVHGSALPI
ncbi:MAG TPA: DUF3306 domain-containing protein [Steroidobacteraceae bacterium]